MVVVTPAADEPVLALLRTLACAGGELRPGALVRVPGGGEDPLAQPPGAPSAPPFSLPRLLDDLANPPRAGAAARLEAFCREHGVVETAVADPADGRVVAYGTRVPDPAVPSVTSRFEGRAVVLTLDGGGRRREIAMPFDAAETRASARLKAHRLARDLVVEALGGPPARPFAAPVAEAARPRPTAARTWARGLLAGAYLYCGYVQVRNLLRRLRGRVPGVVVNFHRVADNRTDHWMTVDTETFDRMMRFLDRHYHVVPIEEMQRRLAGGRNREALAAVTFDDGYLECASAGAAVLENLGVSGAFYVCTRFLDGDGDLAHDLRRGLESLPKMGEPEVCDLVAHGHEVGSHSVSHADFRRASVEEIRDEIEGSKARLERVVGAGVHGFSVPWGSPAHCRREVFRAARAAGYRYVVSHFDGVNFPGEGRFHVRRVRPPLRGMVRFKAAVEGWRGLRGLISRRPERIRVEP